MSMMKVGTHNIIIKVINMGGRNSTIGGECTALSIASEISGWLVQDIKVTVTCLS